MSRSVDRPAGCRRTAGLPLSGVGLQLAGRVPVVNGQAMPIVQREVPVVAQTTPYALTYRLDFLAAAGTLVLIATFIALIPMLASGSRASILASAFGKTVAQLHCRS